MKATELNKVVGLNLPTELPCLDDLITRLERHLADEQTTQSRLAGDDPFYKRNLADYNQRIATLQQILEQLRQPNFQFEPDEKSVLSDISDLSIPPVPSIPESPLPQPQPPQQPAQKINLPKPENPRTPLAFQQINPAQNPRIAAQNAPKPGYSQSKTGSTDPKPARSQFEPKRGPRGILNELPEATQQKILELLETHTEQAVLDILAQPVPQGIGLRISRRSLERFEIRHRVIEHRAEIDTLATAAHELAANPGTTDADLINASLRIVRAAVLEYATDIKNFECLERLNNVLHKLRRDDVADRRQTYLERASLNMKSKPTINAAQVGRGVPTAPPSAPSTNDNPSPLDRTQNSRPIVVAQASQPAVSPASSRQALEQPTAPEFTDQVEVGRDVPGAPPSVQSAPSLPSPASVQNPNPHLNLHSHTP